MEVRCKKSSITNVENVGSVLNVVTSFGRRKEFKMDAKEIKFEEMTTIEKALFITVKELTGNRLQIEFREPDEPIAKEETVIEGVELSNFDKMLYSILPSREAFDSQLENLPHSEATYMIEMFNAIRDIWWATIRLKHKNLRKPITIGIRQGWKFVDSTKTAPPHSEGFVVEGKKAEVLGKLLKAMLSKVEDE